VTTDKPHKRPANEASGGVVLKAQKLKSKYKPAAMKYILALPYSPNKHQKECESNKSQKYGLYNFTVVQIVTTFNPITLVSSEILLRKFFLAIIARNST
jgi:hypothetical protein